MYAIFRAAGFQYRAEPGTLLKLPRLGAQPGESVTFDEVLLGSRGGGAEDVLVGRPFLRGAQVAAEVVRHGRGKKIIVWKFRRRENYRRKSGHRQDFTEVRVSRIDLGDGRGAESAPGVAERGAALAREAEAATVVAPPSRKKRPARPPKAEAEPKPKARAKASRPAAPKKEKGSKKGSSPRKGKKE